MALRIKENNGVIYLQGNMSTTNSIYVKQHTQNVLDNYKRLKLDIKQIKSIDSDGIVCMQKIIEFASNNFRELSIVKNDNQSQLISF